MTALADIEREVLTEGLEDYVGLWEFVWLLRNRHTSASVEQVRNDAMTSVRRLVEGGLMRAGELADDGGFAPWSAGPTEVLKRIWKEWSVLDRDPEIGDICWFSNTDAGDDLARRTQSTGQP